MLLGCHWHLKVPAWESSRLSKELTACSVGFWPFLQSFVRKLTIIKFLICPSEMDLLWPRNVFLKDLGVIPLIYNLWRLGSVLQPLGGWEFDFDKHQWEATGGLTTWPASPPFILFPWFPLACPSVLKVSRLSFLESWAQPILNYLSLLQESVWNLSRHLYEVSSLISLWQVEYDSFVTCHTTLKTF